MTSITSAWRSLRYPPASPSPLGASAGAVIRSVLTEGLVLSAAGAAPSRDPVPEPYFHDRQRPWRTYGMTLIVDAEAPVASLTTAIRSALEQIGPAVPPVFSTMEQRVAVFVEAARFRASLIGATPGAILRTGVWPVAVGGLVGGLSAVALARVLASFLFEIEPRDPSPLLLVAVLMLATGLGASWLPARRASRIKPIDALRV